jgi:hypothetical protein
VPRCLLVEGCFVGFGPNLFAPVPFVESLGIKTPIFGGQNVIETPGTDASQDGEAKVRLAGRDLAISITPSEKIPAHTTIFQRRYWQVSEIRIDALEMPSVGSFRGLSEIEECSRLLVPTN